MDSVLKDTVPPHSNEAERATLGAMLLNWGAVSAVATLLRAEHFYSQQNQVIFSAMMKIFSKGETCDTLALVEELSKEGQLELAGGAAYIASLTDEVPTAANIEYYAKIVFERAVRRSLINVSQDIKASAFDETRDSKLILEDAEKKIFDLADNGQTTQVYSMGNIVPATVDMIENNFRNKVSLTGVPSGFSKLDTMTSGFQKAELVIIGARPSMGKTALALNMMEYISIVKRIPCGFFSLEMSHVQIGQRLLSQNARIPGTKIRNGMLRLDDFQKINDAAGRCYDAPLYIVDTPNMQLIDLRAMARRMKTNQKVEIIFIDYIGLISTENSSAPVYEQVSEISKSLKSLARELNIPIVALCQVARDAEGNEPSLNQLRGSGSIEQDADVVMFIHRERKKQEDGDMEPVQDAKLIVAKQRNGPIGDVPLLFLNAITRFENRAEAE
ncbi:replicative DNA helicase [uncultured Treponema sp.]|uniref:replicative DNA helicase n=1 Tax=uncultured Treponema sp. TaxID=162155 RepID=UPI0025D56076|nr:replicative DNA helicase [uncultured Treponema sp.]